jgi:hypothetical protein
LNACKPPASGTAAAFSATCAEVEVAVEVGVEDEAGVEVGVEVGGEVEVEVGGGVEVEVRGVSAEPPAGLSSTCSLDSPPS